MKRALFILWAIALILSSEAKATRDQRSLAVSDESDGSLFDGSQLDLDVKALASLTDVGDDLSSDAELSDTLDRLLAASEVDEDPALLSAASSAKAETEHQEVATSATSAEDSAHLDAQTQHQQAQEEHLQTEQEHQEHPVGTQQHAEEQHQQHAEEHQQHAGEQHQQQQQQQPEPALLSSQSSAKVIVASPPTPAPKQQQQPQHTEEEEEENEEVWNEMDDLPRFKADMALKAAIRTMAVSDGSALESQGGSNPTSINSSTPTVDRVKAALYIILGLVLVVGVLEVGIQVGEMFLQKSAHPIEKLLGKTYKPLTILAIGAFLLICYARFQWLDKYVGDYSQSLIFDLLLVMFVMGLLYVVAMLCIFAYSTYVVDQWSEIEKKYRSDEAVRNLESLLVREKDAYAARHCCFRFWMACFSRNKIRNLEFEFRYCQMKQHFVKQHHRRFMAAPVGGVPVPVLTFQSLDFHVYLRRCMHLVCQEVASIHWHVWLVVFGVIFLNALRMLIFKRVDTISFVYVSVIMLWGMFFFAIGLSYSVSAATQEIADHYQLYLPERSSDEQLSDDPDDELLRESTQISGTCGVCAKWCCSSRSCDCACARTCCPQPNKQQELFCCKTPASVTRAIQMAILLTSLCIPAYIMDLSHWMTNSATWVKLLVNILIGLAPLLTIILVLPPMIPQFVLSVSVASMSRLTDLRYTMLKINSNTYRSNKRIEQEKERQAREALRAAGALDNKEQEFAIMSSDDEDDDVEDGNDISNRQSINSTRA